MTSSILNLPIEVLTETFGYVRTPFTARPYYTSQGQFSEIVGIRSVCRWFRAVSNELSFWYNEDSIYSILFAIASGTTLSISTTIVCQSFRGLTTMSPLHSGGHY